MDPDGTSWNSPYDGADGGAWNFVMNDPKSLSEVLKARGFKNLNDFISDKKINSFQDFLKAALSFAIPGIGVIKTIADAVKVISGNIRAVARLREHLKTQFGGTLPAGFEDALAKATGGWSRFSVGEGGDGGVDPWKDPWDNLGGNGQSNLGPLDSDFTRQLADDEKLKDLGVTPFRLVPGWSAETASEAFTQWSALLGREEADFQAQNRVRGIRAQRRLSAFSPETADPSRIGIQDTGVIQAQNIRRILRGDEL